MSNEEQITLRKPVCKPFESSFSNPLVIKIAEIKPARHCYNIYGQVNSRVLQLNLLVSKFLGLKLSA